MRSMHRPVALALLVALTFAAQSARAQSAADKAAAEVLFNQGKALLTQGKFAEACPKLAESLRLDTGIGSMLYLADCYERSGKIASAWAQFREAQATAAKDGDARERIARDRADQLEPKLSRLTITVPPESDIEGLVITRDGTAIGRAVWGVDAPVDTGPHVIRITAPGRDPAEATVDVAGNATQSRYTVPVLAIAAAPRVDPGPPTPDRPDPSRGSTQRTVGIIVGAAGVVALGIGAFFGVRAISKLDDSEAHCRDRSCDREGLDLRSSSESQANVATVLFIASGLALAGGTVLWITAPRTVAASATPQRRVVVVPAATPSSASITAALRF